MIVLAYITIGYDGLLQVALHYVVWVPIWAAGAPAPDPRQEGHGELDLSKQA